MLSAKADALITDDSDLLYFLDVISPCPCSPENVEFLYVFRACTFGRFASNHSKTIA